MGTADLPDEIPYMQFFFKAIATGVVNHLTKNPGAFKVVIESADSNHQHEYGAGIWNVKLTTDNDGEHAHNTTVTIEGE